MLFRFRSIGVGLLTGLPFFVSFGGFMFVYGYAAQARGRTPWEIGVSLLPMSVGFLVASLLAGRLVPRYGARVLTVGAFVGAAGFAWLGLIGIGDTARALPPVAVFGLMWSPLMAIILSQVPGHMAGLGSGLLITTMQAGLGLGSAVIGSIYLARSDGFAATMGLLAVVIW